MTNLVSEVVFTSEFSSPDAVRGLDGFDYVWLIFGFDRSERTNNLTVRPPRLGGNERMGVFATRSPFRPNGLGLTLVKLLAIEREKGKTVLKVQGADIADGSPVFDVKPYLPFFESHPEARGGFAEEKLSYKLTVEFPDELKKLIPEEKLDGLIDALSQDPRPAYVDDDRVFGFGFYGKEVKFKVCGGVLTVVSVE